jgi:hypothetical protein
LGGVYSQSVLLKKTAFVAGALTAIVLTAGLFPLSLEGWRWHSSIHRAPARLELLGQGSYPPSLSPAACARA